MNSLTEKSNPHLLSYHIIYYCSSKIKKINNLTFNFFRKLLDKDDRLSEDYIKDIYWDVDLKKAEEDFKNNGYKFRENDDLEKLPTAKKSDPPTSKVESPKKATVTKNKPGPKSKTKISEEGQEDSAVKKNKPGPKSKKDTKSQEIRYVIVDLDFFS